VCLHARPYGGGGYDPLKQAAECRDEANNCRALVAAGKCDAAPELMLGLAGKCRRSCNDCVDCAHSDIVCLRRNMRGLRRMHKQRQAAAAAAAAAAAGGGGSPARRR
jgi:prolyl 4-hydroxylase